MISLHKISKKQTKKNYLTESAGFENMRFTFCTEPVDDIQVYFDFGNQDYGLFGQQKSIISASTETKDQLFMFYVDFFIIILLFFWMPYLVICRLLYAFIPLGQFENIPKLFSQSHKPSSSDNNIINDPSVRRCVEYQYKFSVYCAIMQ